MNRHRSRLFALIALAGGLLLSCSAPPKPSGEVVCLTGERLLSDGRCQPPGLPLDMACPPGEAPVEGGGCQAAGVPADQCGDGFESDSEGGCLPILPAEPCAPGLLAIPGETECHEISPCGAGTWGDIPVEADTQFVDQSYPGADSDGSQDRPWKTVQEAIDAAEKGAIVAIAAGTYAEDLTLSFKRKRIWGRCPSMVTLQGVDPEGVTLQVFVPDAEIRGVAIQGPGEGVYAHNADSLLLDRVWIHDTKVTGLYSDSLSTVTLSGSLVESTGFTGVSAFGSSVTIEGSALRDVLAGTDKLGVSIYGAAESGARASVTVRGSVIERSFRSGVEVADTDLLVERVAVRGAPESPDPAISRYGVLASKGSSATIDQTTIEGAHASIVVETATGIVDRVTVRDAPSPPAGQIWTAGILIQSDVLAGETADVTVKRTAVLRQPQFGISALGATVQILSTRATGNVKDKGHHAAVDAERSKMTIEGCAILDNTHFGLSVEGADVTLLSSVIRGVTATTDAGECVAVRHVLGPGALDDASVFTMRSSILEDCVQAGIIATDSQIHLESSVLRDVKKDATDSFGDVVALVVQKPETPSSSVTGVLIESAERAGIFSFGGKLGIGFSAVECGLFDLVGEDSSGLPFSYTKTGDNICGCPKPSDLCRIVSPGLSAPQMEQAQAH